MDKEKVEFRKVIDLLKQKKAYLEQEVKRNEQICENLDKRINAIYKGNKRRKGWETLLKTFSPEQVQNFGSKIGRPSGYSDDDHAISWTLHNLMRNSRAYNYIRYNMQIKIPNRSRVARWRSQKQKRIRGSRNKKILEEENNGMTIENQDLESKDLEIQNP